MANGGAGIIGGGLDLLGGAISMGLQARENRLNREWAEKMRDYENEYNSPKQQIARLKEAGLNPALIYQQSAGSMTSASVPSPSNAGRPLGKLDLRSAFDAYMDAQLKDQQLQNIELQNDILLTQNDIAKADLETKQLVNERARWMRDNGDWSIQLNLSSTQLENLKKAREKLDAEISNINNNISLSKKQFVLAQNKDAREQARLQIEQSINAREQIAFDYLNEVREQSRIDGKTFESVIHDLDYQLKLLTKEEKDLLKSLEFDVDNPPKTYREYQHWISLATQKAQKDLSEASKLLTDSNNDFTKSKLSQLNYDQSYQGRAIRSLDKVPVIGPIINAIYMSLRDIF